jgi:hypothetical protein
MRKPKETGVEPMPRCVRLGLAAFAIVLVVLVLVVGKYYLPNWKGDAIFLPFAIFIGLVLVSALAALVVRLFKKR